MYDNIQCVRGNVHGVDFAESFPRIEVETDFSLDDDDSPQPPVLRRVARICVYPTIKFQIKISPRFR